MPRKKHQVGTTPGTLDYSGEYRNEKVKITLTEYNEGELIEKDFDDIDECMSHIKPGMVKWINVDGIHDLSLIEKIGKAFNIHALTLEDIVNIDQRPKFEDYDNYVVSIMKMLYFDSELHSEQLCIILMDGLVISFQEVHGGDAFNLVRARIRSGKGRIRKAGADYLAYALMDAVVDFYFVVLEKIADRLDIIDRQLLNEENKRVLVRLHSVKGKITNLRKFVWPMRELLANMERSETELISDSTKVYIRDVSDHTIRVIDTVETYRDLVAGMMDIYMSSVSHKMNEIMKVLTIISTIFIPVTFIVGVYGMNFEYMPELASPWGYWIVWAIMITVMLSLVFYFRRKKWL
jgi:magnesium transporter